MGVKMLTDESFDKNVWLSPSIDKGGSVAVVLFTKGDKAKGDERKKASERMSDLMTEVAGDYKEKAGLKFFEMDFSLNPLIAARYNIQSAPTLLLLQVEEVVGSNTKEWIKAKIDRKME